MSAEVLKMLAVAAIAGLAVVGLTLLFLIRFVGRRPRMNAYVETCRECGVELAVPSDNCPSCGCFCPSAERQGGDVNDDESGDGE